MTTIVSFLEGELDAWAPPVASGTGTLYWSDHRFAFPTPDPNDFEFPEFPFDPQSTSKATLAVNLQTGQVSFGKGWLTGECLDRVIRGTIPGQWLNSQFILSLKTVTTTIPT
jgi:hypothetical protein